ncbi:dehydratase [Aeromicrobium sp. 636]|uniref:MaoC family dehydratase n=1 Tax=Aeromicrobium senzhongii TaxID=2663859 RepID=A0A8I0EY63_9ACTN|nr:MULTISPECIES: MaoC family dehydratase [Aeromicrobium]MBC9227683.1 MaoC family dehydratase [Aeromicrobium senzhongii]MCQ3999780.1 dehydratase [Aeromicrobium sp. 636]MTB89699.1 dehydratase [Aeromicrobium senzhongii]QNL94179.1 MaoC family dehydratase [Aeromicrobium senzhongii]
MTREFETIADLKAAVGQELGTSDWVTVTQDKINLFADATGDHQWIHVDPEAAAQGPFGKTIAHGYLTLSLLPVFTQQIYAVKSAVMGVNYGANKVRFPHPVPVDSRIRGTATLKETQDIAIGTQIVLTVVVEIDGVEKPACIADVVYVVAEG